MGIPVRPRVPARRVSALLDGTNVSDEQSTHSDNKKSATRRSKATGHNGNAGIDDTYQGSLGVRWLNGTLKRLAQGSGSNGNSDWDEADEAFHFTDDEILMINDYLAKMGLSTVDHVVKYPPTWPKYEAQCPVWEKTNVVKSQPLKIPDSQLPLWFDPGNLVGFRSTCADWRYSPKRLAVIVRYKLVVLKKDGFEDWRDCRFSMIDDDMKAGRVAHKLFVQV